MIRSVARHVRYTPETIENLYVDNIDFYGLEYWYDDAIASEKEIKDRSKKKK